MSKTALKTSISEKQKGACALTQTPLKPNLSLVDTDRKIQKKDGGIYTPENTRIVDPVAHMKRHGTYRERDEQVEKLKSTMDGRFQVRKLLSSVTNRMLAIERGTDDMDTETHEWLMKQKKDVESRLSKIDREITKQIKKIDIPVAKSALEVKGIGAVTIAHMLVYIDIHKANYCSSLWAYVGLDKPSHERYTKGEAGGGNKNLRTVLYTMADSMIKTRGAYREVYDRRKARLEVSEKVTQSRNTQGKLVESKWKDTKPSHRHGASLREVMKHFLADWWYVHRTTEGLPTASPYPIEKLGHTTWIMPEERGWKY
jgi:hypothetical protein